MLCAVIDTNVIVSALLKWDSIPGQVLQAVFEGDVVPVYNDEILAEYNLVLNRDKFHFPKDLLDATLCQIRQLGIAENELVEIVEKMPDPKDMVFYSVALAHGKTTETHLVTGNTKHFPATPVVVTPREFLEKLK